MLYNVIAKRVEKIEIEVLPDVKIKAEKFYYSINVDKMMWFLKKQKNEEIRFPISKEFGFLFSLPFLTWRYNGSHKYPKEIN